MRYFCTVAYDGSNYHGWQSQKNAISVQQVIEESFSTVLRRATVITGSGRTDTGVHATRQVFHFDTEKTISESGFHKFNSILPKDISIRNLVRVVDHAHARFDATQRSYEYYIIQDKDPFMLNRAYRYSKDLDLDKMNNACQVILQTNDFESFSRVHTDVNNFLCEISEAYWEEQNDLIVFHVSSNRFLRGMVRAMVGTLLDIGIGKTTLTDLKSTLISKDRQKAGRSVPAMGLYLSNVEYPDQIFRY